MRRLRILFVVAVALFPATSGAMSIHTAEREAVCANPGPSAHETLPRDPRSLAPTANAGSGQLPMGLIQTRNASGQYDGGIGFNCLPCYAVRIGDATPERPDLGTRMGIGNTTFDIDVFSYDLGKAGGVPIPLPYPHNQGRGTINAVSDFEFLMAVRDFDTLDSTPFVKVFPAHASPGDQDPPAWHNPGSRPRVYMDGGVSADNTRALMQFLTASITTSTCTDARAENTPDCGAWIKSQQRDFEDIRTFIESIEPPAFPRSSDPASPQYVDDAEAARGEQLFHCKNLFGPDLSADPASCAAEPPAPPASRTLFGHRSCR